jgi:hypothetical protein
MKLILLTFLTILSLVSFANADMTEETITVKCEGWLEKYDADEFEQKTTKKKFVLDITKVDEKDPGHISKNGILKFSDGYSLVYNISVFLGKNANLFNPLSETLSQIRARLQRDTVGNGKTVLGASVSSFKQKAQKKKSSIALDIINVNALNNVVKAHDSLTIDEDPILFQSNYKESVFEGTLDKGVVKSAHIECLTL